MNFSHGLAYAWAFPATTLGLTIAGFGRATGGSVQVVDGVVEAHGGGIKFFLGRVVGLTLPGGASALTLGHVVLGVDAAALARTRAHERVHVHQYERWGPLFLPAYGASSLVAWVRRRDPYRNNRFEREAYAVAP